jgi:outer membrane protein TolC
MIFFFCLPGIKAQDTLSLQEAIDVALKNNFQIEISRNNLEIATNNNNPGNAGMLPSVGVTVGDTPSQNNIRQEFSNGTTIIRDGVVSNNFNAQIAINMTLFDGGKMFATREKLNEMQRLGELYLKADVQNVVSEVVGSYYYILTQSSYLEVLQKLAAVSETRLELMNARLEAGLANNADKYLAEIDMEMNTQAIIAQQTNISNAIISLNKVLQLPADSVYRVENSFYLTESLKREELNTLFEQNPEFLVEDSKVKIALKSEKEASASRFPKISLSAAYGYLLTKSQAGFSLYNQAYGPTGTISLNIPLFSGNVNKVNYRNAALLRENAEITQKQTTLSLQADYERAWQLYNSSLLQVRSGQETIKRAENYLTIIQSRLDLGESTILELREAQRALNDAGYRLYSNQYLLKIAETDLLRLTGQLAY